MSKYIVYYYTVLHFYYTLAIWSLGSSKCYPPSSIYLEKIRLQITPIQCIYCSSGVPVAYRFGCYSFIIVFSMTSVVLLDVELSTWRLCVSHVRLQGYYTVYNKRKI